jgi:hypothetical protein
MLGSAAGGIGSALGSAGSAIGSTLGMGEGGVLSGLGQAIPEGVELVGPDAAFAPGEQALLGATPTGTGGMDFLSQGAGSGIGMPSLGQVSGFANQVNPIMQLVQQLQGMGGQQGGGGGMGMPSIQLPEMGAPSAYPQAGQLAQLMRAMQLQG